MVDHPAEWSDNPYLVGREFTEHTSRYCHGNDVSADAVEAWPALLMEQHRCDRKCADGCRGDSCFCGGWEPRYDAAGGSALCLPRYECEHLCRLLGTACYGVDMHATKPRCFVKTPACATQVEDTRTLGMDADYSLLVKGPYTLPARVAPEAAEKASDAVDWAQSVRGSVVSPSGSSTAWVLRFTSLQLPAGTFRACFCDSAVAGTCRSAADFGVDLGKVHVSGIACMLQEPKLRTAECYKQYYGGLSCAAST